MRNVQTSATMKIEVKACAVILCPLLLAGCLTDAATRLAYDIEAGAGRVGKADGARYTLVHRVPSSAGECVGQYRVQFDKVGALIVWCRDAAGSATVSSHSTSYHARYVDAPETHIVDKPAREALVIDLERRGGRVVIANVK